MFYLSKVEFLVVFFWFWIEIWSGHVLDRFYAIHPLIHWFGLNLTSIFCFSTDSFDTFHSYRYTHQMSLLCLQCQSLTCLSLLCIILYRLMLNPLCGYWYAEEQKKNITQRKINNRNTVPIPFLTNVIDSNYIVFLNKSIMLHSVLMHMGVFVIDYALYLRVFLVCLSITAVMEIVWCTVWFTFFNSF